MPTLNDGAYTMSSVGASRAGVIAEYNAITGAGFPDGTDWCAIFCTVALYRASSAHPEWYSALADDWRWRAQNWGVWQTSVPNSQNVIIGYDYNNNNSLNHVEVLHKVEGDTMWCHSGNSGQTTYNAGIITRPVSSAMGFAVLDYPDMVSGGSTPPVVITPSIPNCDCFDYSWARPDPPTMYSAGIKAVYRYVGPSSWGKTLTISERDALLSAGVSIGLVYEYEAGAPLAGYTQGVQDATDVQGYLTDLEFSNTTPVAFCFDSPLCETDPNSVQYMLGVLSVLPTAYAYASSDMGQSLIDGGAMPGGAFWQTYAWSEGDLHPNAAVYQWSNGENFYGSSVDYNNILQAVNWWVLPDGNLGSLDPFTGETVPTQPGTVTPSPFPKSDTHIRMYSNNDMVLADEEGHKFNFRNQQGIWIPVNDVKISGGI